jgi:hypothetical protein
LGAFASRAEETRLNLEVGGGKKNHKDGYNQAAYDRRQTPPKRCAARRNTE